MPFTFSHPALVLPLSAVFRKRTSLTGLVAGSMAPDFEKILTMKLSNGLSHSIAGVFLFSLPVSLALCFMFHLFVRDALIENLPGFLRSRLYVYRNLNWLAYFRKHSLVVVGSVLTGALSHLLWDGFTHSDGFLADRPIPFLGEGTEVAGVAVSAFQVLQLISSLGGLVVIFYATLRLPVGLVPKPNKSIILYWLLVAFVAVALVVLRVLVYTPDRRLEVALTAVLAFLLSLVLAPLLRKSFLRFMR